MDSSSNSNVSCRDGHSSVLDESYDDVDVFLNYEAVYHEKLKEQVENFDRIIWQLRHMKYLSPDLLPKVFHGLTCIMYLSYTSNINLEHYQDW